MDKLNNKNIQILSLSCLSFSIGYFVGYHKFPFNLFYRKEDKKGYKKDKKKKRNKKEKKNI